MNTSDFAIKVQNISKCHHIYDNPSDRLKQFIVPRIQKLILQKPKQYFHDFWALKDVSFEIKKGDAFGVIGRNGSGKSTLLQMICGTLTPSDGSVQTNGRIAALLELGSGFNFDFTGRENIYLNGSILGLSVEEIDNRIDRILAFADIGEFIDQPVKTYSSGMFVRLAFAVQVNVDPEILIVDEALSVGDFFFQQKCFAKIREMRAEGLTLLFVSHDMGTVRDLCPNSIYLIKGKVAFVGESQEAIRSYLSEDTSLAPVDPLHLSAEPIEPEETSVASEIQLEDARQLALWRRDSASLNNDHLLLAVVVRDTNGLPATSVRMGDKLIFQVYFKTNPNEKGHISLVIKNKYDQIVCHMSSYLMGMAPLSTKERSYGIFEFEIDCMIEAGLYSVMVAYGLPNAPNRGKRLDETGWLGPLQINWDYEMEIAPFLGMFGLPVRGKFDCERRKVI
jgi:lipopolysaccharide transport system ATP-binding protein